MFGLPTSLRPNARVNRLADISPPVSLTSSFAFPAALRTLFRVPTESLLSLSLSRFAVRPPVSIMATKYSISAFVHPGTRSWNSAVYSSKVRHPFLSLSYSLKRLRTVAPRSRIARFKDAKKSNVAYLFFRLVDGAESAEDGMTPVITQTKRPPQTTRMNGN